MNNVNIGIMQSSGGIYHGDSIARIETQLEKLMSAANRPDLVVGTEFSLGLQWEGKTGSGVESLHDCIPGRITEQMRRLAHNHGIYFIPGSMVEYDPKDGNLYNALPIFSPSGELIDVYRKMCPYYPVEEGIAKGGRYVVFPMPEKSITVGVMICHDWCFPEISRNLTLLGAELLIRPAVDPEGLYETCKSIPATRAFENQAYFLSVNMVGEFGGSYAYGHSMLSGPDGRTIYEAGSREAMVSIPLDFDAIKHARRYGTHNTEQLLRQLPYFNLPMPYALAMKDAPLFKDLPSPDLTVQSRHEDLARQKPWADMKRKA